MVEAESSERKNVESYERTHQGKCFIDIGTHVMEVVGKCPHADTRTGLRSTRIQPSRQTVHSKRGTGVKAKRCKCRQTHRRTNDFHTKHTQREIPIHIRLRSYMQAWVKLCLPRREMDHNNTPGEGAWEKAAMIYYKSRCGVYGYNMSCAPGAGME